MNVSQLPPAFQPPVRHLEESLRSLRAGRASSALVEDIDVEAYGTRLRLRELAVITTKDANTIQLEPWDDSVVKAVERAIASSNLGVNPSTVGTVIRVVLPSLTAERRIELTRLVRQRLEEARVSVRNTREKLLKDLRARQDRGELSEDAHTREQKKLQNEVDAVIETVTELGKRKEEEILTN